MKWLQRITFRLICFFKFLHQRRKERSSTKRRRSDRRSERIKIKTREPLTIAAASGDGQVSPPTFPRHHHDYLTAINMAQLADSLTSLDAQWARFLRRLLRSFRRHLLSCFPPGRSGRFRQLKASPPEPRLTVGQEVDARRSPVGSNTEEDADVLSLKISLLGDCYIGKTSFMVCSSSAHAIIGTFVAFLFTIHGCCNRGDRPSTWESWGNRAE